jgi:hypothetical protein
MTDNVKVIRHSNHGPTIMGSAWFIGWLFTIGFLKLTFWKGFLALILWPYYLGVFFHK